MTNEEYEMQVEELTDDINEAWEEVANGAQEELDELMESFEEDSNNDA